MGKSNGKGGASSSSQPEAEAQQKRRRLVHAGDPDPDEDAPPRVPKPKWTSGSLLDQPVEWQTELFHDQMNDLQQRKEAFLCEKEVREFDFGPFGITDKFKALGWEAALKCYDGESKNLYDAEIQEWMATLRCPPYKAPSKMKLIGTVNNVEVEMSFDSLRRIAKFDSKSANQYIFPSLDDLYFNPQKHPRWHNMLDYLFLPGTSSGKLYRRNLRIEAKLMLVICTQNVIPRRGDKVEVRFPEVPVLYMLMNGSPLVPFRFLVLNNIWISRNSGERKIIPHCRLITALLKLYGAIGSEDKGSYKRFKPFDLKNLGPGWEYKESERYHKIKSDGQRWRALKVDAQPLQPGEVDEPEVVMRSRVVMKIIERMHLTWMWIWVELGRAVGFKQEEPNPGILGVHLTMHNSPMIRIGLILGLWSKLWKEGDHPCFLIGLTLAKCFLITKLLWGQARKGR